MTPTPGSGTMRLMPADALDEVARATQAVATPLRFEQVYAEQFDYVWRSARRLGVSPASADDVVQEVFLVVHRRLAEFEGRASVKTWLSRILINVVQTHFRTRQRKARYFEGSGGLDPDGLLPSEVGPSPCPEALGPEAITERKQAGQVLHWLLDQLDHDKRVVFVLVELEELSVTQAAEVLDVNVNTLHSRLRAARRDFGESAARFRAQEGWGTP